MFRKLISNLPFQPSLLADVAFYAKRLKKETAIRRIGAIMLLVGFSMQLFTVAFPPQSSLATDWGDIVYGAHSKNDILNAYKNNVDQLGRTDIQAIYNHYGITEAQIQNATEATITDSAQTLINTSRSTTKVAQTFIPINNAVNGGIYEFNLKYWRNSRFSSNGYPTITGISQYGFRFWILLGGCGNIIYEQGAKKPILEISKTLTSTPQPKVGDTTTFDIRFRNTGAISAQNVVIADDLPTQLEYLSFTATADLAFTQKGQRLEWRIPNTDSTLSSGERWHQISIKTKAKEPAKNVCNTAGIASSNASGQNSAQNTACVNITTIPTCADTPTLPECKPPPTPSNPIIVTDKSVTNNTQSIADANNTTAQPGDTLTYNLFITNKGNAPRENLKLDGEYSEDVRDILEYADITVLNDAILNDQTKKLSWAPVSLAPGQTITKTFTVKVKNPLPATPISASNPLSYDFSMHNVYGRNVTVNLPKPASKAVEQTVTQLPNTGPPMSMAIAVLGVMIVGYFYYRNRLLNKELAIIQKEFKSGGL